MNIRASIKSLQLKFPSTVAGGALLLGAGAGWGEGAQFYDFNNGLPAGLKLFGNAAVAPDGGPDGSGFLSLTEAESNKNGALRFPGPVAHVDQLRLKFKVRISDGTQADGFSLTVAPDLPQGTYGTPENGYRPAATDLPRFIVSFDTYDNGGSDFIGFTVSVNGKTIAEIPAGEGDVPPIYNDFGEWVDVDIHLKRSGKLTLTYGGVKILDDAQTGFEGIDNAWIGLDARTGTNFETHWFDDISLDFEDGDGGPLGIDAAESELAPVTVVENTETRFAVVPTGTGPFSYQWFRNGAPLEGQTGRVLRLRGALTDAGDYSVTVSNAGGSVTSATAKLTVTPDTAAPRLVSVETAAGSVNEIRLTFDEPLDEASATTLSNYAAGSLTILSATLSADGKTVVLKTSPQVNGQGYTVNVTGLKDRSAAGNTHAGVVQFTAKANYANEVLVDGPVRYWRFEEGGGTRAASDAHGANTDPAVLTATLQSGEFNVVPSLLPGLPETRAVSLSAEEYQWIQVPNATDINTGSSYPKKTVEFWFKPAGVPAPETFGAEATAGLWEEGGADRGLNVYLWRDPESLDPDRVSLVFHAFNRLADGPGSPFGLQSYPAVYAEYPDVRVGETYHVVAVLDGDENGTNGSLILYVNGREVSRAEGAGRLYGHGSDVRIGGGNGRTHEDINGAFFTFDGVIDEVAHYNTALSAERVEAHYFAGIGATGAGAVSIDPSSDLGNKTVDENTPARFTVVPSGDGPFTFQWYRDGVALEGETGRVLNLSGALAEAGGYTVRVSNAANHVVSAPAVLTVNPDLASPKLLAAEAVAGSINQVNLTFDEPVDPVTGGNPASYSIPGLTVLAATPGENGKTVILQTTPQQNGQTYTVNIAGLKDRSAAGNPLTTAQTVVSKSDYRYEVLADNPVRYWRFEETFGETAESLATGLDTSPSAVNAVFKNGEFTEAASLLPSRPGDNAAALEAPYGQWISVPNGSDINATKGPWAKKTVELWFKANSLPEPGYDGIFATAGLWEQGGDSRNLAVYLWRNPENPDSNQVSLVFHAFNKPAGDGPGSPFGVGGPGGPVYVEVPGIRAGQVYHVVAVFDGDNAGTNGSLILYVNGVEAGRAFGVGQLYNHTGDVRIGGGNGVIHTGENGELLTFDGVIDEVALYNTALPADRVAVHWAAGSGQAGPVDGAPVIHGVSVQNGVVTVVWSGGGILQKADTPAGPFTDIPSAVSPYTEAVNPSGRGFFRVVVK